MFNVNVVTKLLGSLNIANPKIFIFLTTQFSLQLQNNLHFCPFYNVFWYYFKPIGI